MTNNNLTLKSVSAFVMLFIITNGYSQTSLFDNGWRFHRGGMQRAEVYEFDDSSWRMVDLPHDWSIEDLQDTESPFDHYAVSQVGGGYTVGGTGWYRKSFNIPEGYRNKKIYIQFDGVYMNCDVWINGKHIGNHPYGYTSFWFDLTDKIMPGKNNIIAVQVKNEGQNSRWYSGSGIYRHVWLRITDPVHIAQWGIRITTPEVSRSSAKVKINTKITNGTINPVSVKLLTIFLNSARNEVNRLETTKEFNPGDSYSISQEIFIHNPELWSVDSPLAQTAVSELYCNGILADRAETKFGIRSIKFSAGEGFLINGVHLKLRGGCVHHDNGPIGARANDRAEERRVELLKESGFNAVRCAHNPPSPAFLDACDRLGILVVDEAFDMWKLANNPYDYHLWFDEWWEKDIESMVIRDINHPSVILWSIGNEISGMENPEIIAIERKMTEKVHSLDPTRPVTAAVNQLRPQKDNFFGNLDVCGYNYALSGDHGVENLYFKDHIRVPERIMFGSESYPSAAFSSWMSAVDNKFVIGDFVWTAFDYIGEASIGWLGYWQEDFYPWNLAYCGDIDICGWKRPQSYYRDALWKENQISVFVKSPIPTFPANPGKQAWSKWDWPDVVDDWTWEIPENEKITVYVYSSCDTAELLLNDKSLGKKRTARNTRFTAEWELPYKKGTLKAVGYTKGKKVAASALQSSGQVTSIKLSPDRSEISANDQDISYITVELVDSDGNRNPKADNLIKFKIEGEGTILAVGNANPNSIESNQSPQRKAWRGRCLVIVKSNGKPGIIKVTASSYNLQGATAYIKTE